MAQWTLAFVAILSFFSVYVTGKSVINDGGDIPYNKYIYDYEMYGQPEQVHLSYGESPSEMTVTWLTPNYTAQSIVEYGLTPKYNLVAYGKMRNFTDSGSEKRIFYIHQVTLTGLKPGQRYYYHCGSERGWGDEFHFTAMKNGTDWVPRFVVYGDMGWLNPESLPRIQYERQKGMYDAVLHVGDMAYNLNNENGKYGDEFFRAIEPVAAYIPYMTCVGNHESGQNFSQYKYRLSMPKAGGDGMNLWYSFDVGPAHIIAFSTEVYYYVQYGWELIVEQYRWLEAELKKANLPENRKERPWIIVIGHRPMYCSTIYSDMCLVKINRVRDGMPPMMYFGLEELFYNYGVDLEIYGHAHNYERMWPIYKKTVCNGSYENPYVNPTAPVHIITGTAGCAATHDHFVDKPFPYSAFRNNDYGYTRMNILNSSHLYMEQVSATQKGKVVDKMMLVKETHGAGTYTCHKNVKN